ncbi:glycosyltransferase 87 family protein [Amycolatopsis mongoliensis]|uniref:Glycosyltransferase 87 family protein n=1 Tax=Amycolatopsis mongoliensis TaxID=715475 RepID=A0A9Y2NMY8_9PSEU|nr:glycosyltransferase 87 family protein [Amycolatopsis sp. 4-36]WIY05343.1 glycosyltransferase 87 family protein [Amycolatopsis sp. 4-36]
MSGWSGRKLVAGLAVLEVAAVVLVLVLKRFDGLDLEVYLGGAKALAENGSPYDAWVPTTHQILLPFTYTPFAAAVFLPGTLLPFAVTMKLVSIASIVATGVVAYLYVATLNGSLTDPAKVNGRVSAALVAIGAQLAGALLEPVRSTLGFGQINALLMVLVVLDVLLPGDRRRTKGLLIGVAAAIKLTPAVFVVYFLVRRDFKSAARVVAGFVAAGALLWLVRPSASFTYWTKLVFDAGRIGGVDYVGNQSLRGLVTRLGLPETAGNVGWLLAVLAVMAVVAVVIVRAGEPVLALTACALGGLLVSPISWTHHWTWCVPILVLAGYYGARAWRTDRVVTWWSGAVVAAGLALFIVGPMWFAPRPAPSAGWWLATESYELFGLLLLALAAFAAPRLKAVNVASRDSKSLDATFTDL